MTDIIKTNHSIFNISHKIVYYYYHLTVITDVPGGFTRKCIDQQSGFITRLVQCQF